MDNKENIHQSYSANKNLEKVLSSSMKFTGKNSSLINLTGELDMQKEYLAKLKIQRHKTQKLHSEYIKLKKEKDKLKEDQELELSSLKIKLSECQSELNKRSEQSKILEKEAQKLRAELDKINRERSESINSVKLSYEHSIMELKHNMDNLNESLQSKNKQINNLKKIINTKTTQLQNERNQYESNWKISEQKLKQTEEKRKQCEKTISQFSKRLDDLSSECYRYKNELDVRNKQLNILKASNQRIQMDYQTSCRKVNDLENKYIQMEQRLIQKQKENEKIRWKYEQIEQKLRCQSEQKQKWKADTQQTKSQIQIFKIQITRRQQSIRDLQTKIMKREDEQFWKTQLNQKIAENQELFLLLQNLKSQNDQLIKFIKQKERERKTLVQYQMEEISKFENLLKDVK